MWLIHFISPYLIAPAGNTVRLQAFHKTRQQGFRLIITNTLQRNWKLAKAINCTRYSHSPPKKFYTYLMHFFLSKSVPLSFLKFVLLKLYLYSFCHTNNCRYFLDFKTLLQEISKHIIWYVKLESPRLTCQILWSVSSILRAIYMEIHSITWVCYH